MHGVFRAWYHVAQSPVYLPCIVAFGYLFVLCGIVAVLVEVPVLSSLSDISLLIDLIKAAVVLCTDLSEHKRQHEESRKYFPHYVFT